MDVKNSCSPSPKLSSASFTRGGGGCRSKKAGSGSYDTRSLDRRKHKRQLSSLVKIDTIDNAAAVDGNLFKDAMYCTLRRRPTEVKITSPHFPSLDDAHRVRKVVKSTDTDEDEDCLEEEEDLARSEQEANSTKLPSKNSVAASSNASSSHLQTQQSSSSSSSSSSTASSSSSDVIKNPVSASASSSSNQNNVETDYNTSDEDDLSHAEELSYSSHVTSTSVESLTSSNTNLNIVLPTGWHRHPHMHMHQDPDLGPLDEIVNDEDDGEPTTEHIYSSVRKKEVIAEGGCASGIDKRPRLASAVLRSSRILRRHTTYYHAKQFDSLPPQGSLMSTSISPSNSKPHVHSWHRHKQKHHQVSHHLYSYHFI